MEKERVKKILVELYNEFQKSLIEAEKKGKGNYTDEDFDSLTQFMTFIHNNTNMEHKNEITLVILAITVVLLSISQIISNRQISALEKSVISITEYIKSK